MQAHDVSYPHYSDCSLIDICKVESILPRGFRLIKAEEQKYRESPMARRDRRVGCLTVGNSRSHTPRIV